jgi:multidrug efflux system membrane fusion protein
MTSPPGRSPAADRPESAPAAERSRPGGRVRWLGSTLAVLALLALGALAWHLTHCDAVPPQGAGAAGPGGGGPGGAGGPGGGRRAPATTVGVATAVSADLPVTLEALGTVTPAATVTVRPQVSGVLKRVAFGEGQMVRAGQLLVEIDARPFELALQQAIGQRQRDEAQLENARVTLQRYRTLSEQDSIARQDVDTQAALVKQLEATVVIDRANEASARLNLSYCRVVAPISGRVGLRVVDVGNVVSSNDTAGVALITQLAPIDVEFSLPQDDVPALQAQIAGGSALTAVALDRTRSKVLAEGRFLALDNLVDVQTGTVRAKARFANEAGTLFPSQFVNVRLRLRTINDAVLVPVAALRHGNAGDFVYLLNAADRTVAVRPVSRGQATDTQVQVTQGLRAGDRVITEGGDRLRDGARVTLPDDAPAERRGRAAGGASAPEASRAASAPRAGGSAPDGERRRRAPAGDR